MPWPSYFTKGMGVWASDCFMGGFEPQVGVAAKVARCLQRPASAGGSQTPTMFLVGDSHALAMLPGLAASVHGSMNLVWSTIGSGCGFRANDAGFDLYDRAMCLEYRAAAITALQAHVMTGDVIAVVVMHDYLNNNQTGHAAFLEATLANMTKSRGAQAHEPTVAHVRRRRLQPL